MRVLTACLLAQLVAGVAAAQPGSQYLPPPLLGPPKLNAYGPGTSSDATGRPFHYETQDGTRLTIEPPPKANAYGLGVDMDVYGRPVRAVPDDGFDDGFEDLDE